MVSFDPQASVSEHEARHSGCRAASGLKRLMALDRHALRKSTALRSGSDAPPGAAHLQLAKRLRSVRSRSTTREPGGDCACCFTILKIALRPARNEREARWRPGRRARPRGRISARRMMARADSGSRLGSLLVVKASLGVGLLSRAQRTPKRDCEPPCGTTADVTSLSAPGDGLRSRRFASQCPVLFDGATERR
jgi:hypothetical protein